MRRSRPRPASALLAALAATCLLVFPTSRVQAQSENVVRCPATRDVWLSAMEDERDFNMGRARTLKLKLWQEFALVDFDVSAVAGHTVDRATLFIKPAGGHRLGLNGGSDLRWLTVSTVTHDWIEGRSRDYGTDRRGNGATFNESSYRAANWGWDGARVWDVILGHGHSLRFDGRLSPTGDGWLKMEIDPTLVSSLVAGTSHGLALMDGSTAVMVNSLIESRESGSGPYLAVELGAADSSPPTEPTSVRVISDPPGATESRGAARISLQLAPDTFAIDLRIGGNPVDRWQIPHPGAGEPSLDFAILDLEPNAGLDVEVAAIDAAGNRSSWSRARGRSSSAVTPVRVGLPTEAVRSVPGGTGALPDLWALPAISKLDPFTERLIDEPTPPGFFFQNPVWNRDTGTVALAAARGEIVSFQLATRVTGNACVLDLPDLRGPTTISSDHAFLWRNWQVGEVPELAIPVAGPVDLPFTDNSLPGQESQIFTIDYFIPGDTARGTYSGTLTLECQGGAPHGVDVDIEVFDVVIPDQTRFNLELNTYRGPGPAGSKRFIASQQLAHYHRATINRVPYSQKGRSHEDWTPETDAGGQVISWDRFARHLGGMLDGSWFENNPRRGVPAPVLYLPLFEGWPRDYRAEYDPGVPVPESAADPLARLRHDILASPIEDSLPQRYARAFQDALRGFVEHATRKQWNRTQFQIYLNNKPKYHYSLWSFDEPFKLLDWRAVNYFASLTREVLGPTSIQPGRFQAGSADASPQIAFRADVSRPMWQGSVANGLVDALYLSDQAYRVPRLVQNLGSRMPATLYNYGHTNGIDESNWRTVAWCLDAYLHGFEGVLPWQSIAGPRALTEPMQNALIIDGGDHGLAIASLRLHALREGAQLVELLRLLQASRGWSRNQIAALVHQHLPRDPRIDRPRSPKTPLAAARELEAGDFLQLKLTVLQLLDQASRAGARP